MKRRPRIERESEVNALVADWAKRFDKHEAMRQLGAAGIPAGAVLDTKELAEDGSLQERGIMQTMQHPVIKEYCMPTWPVRHDRAPVSVKAAPPWRAFGRGVGELARAHAAQDRRPRSGAGDQARGPMKLGRR
jgi:crotonobetainyl-CoA:carnitine CoA-transferase CaiB-like acyl-CoA transferase